MVYHSSIRHQVSVTLIELLVVVLIIGILATIATGVYSGEKQRAQVVATQDLIRQLEVAITRYEVDVGMFPPSGSGTTFPPVTLDTTSVSSRRNGSAYLYVALVHSLSGNANAPASALWNGPYINIQARQLAASRTTTPLSPGEIDILDPWGNPLRYIAFTDYGVMGTDFGGGTKLFQGGLPTGANPALPAPSPFLAQGETYYNSRSYQIYSLGPDGTTFSPFSIGGFTSVNYAGTMADDINNFGY